MGRKLILKRSRSFLSSAPLVKCRVYSVLPAISSSYPHLKGRLPTCSSPVRHSRREASSSLAVRLACLRRAASVRSEPGSNSPLFYFKHPEGRLISIILKASPVSFILGTLTFKRKKKNNNAQQLFITPHALFLSQFFVLRLFPYQRFCSLAFSSFPSLLISKTSLLNRSPALERRKRKGIYQKTIRFVKYLLFFFIFIFLSQDRVKERKRTATNSRTCNAHNMKTL